MAESEKGNKSVKCGPNFKKNQSGDLHYVH